MRLLCWFVCHLVLDSGFVHLFECLHCELICLSLSFHGPLLARPSSPGKPLFISLFASLAQFQPRHLEDSGPPVLTGTLHVVCPAFSYLFQVGHQGI